MRIVNCEFPDDLLYDTEMWVWGKPEGDVLRIGLTSILSWSYGTFSSVTFETSGKKLSRGQVVGSVDGSRHFDVVRAPVVGSLLRGNGLLTTTPEVLNKDPYGEGWFAEIKVSQATLSPMKTLPEAAPTIEREVRQRRVRCFAAFPDYEIFDAGAECAAVLVKLNELLANSKEGSVVHVISDDPKSEGEMEKWAEITGNSVLESRKEGGYQHYIVRKAG